MPSTSLIRKFEKFMTSHNYTSIILLPQAKQRLLHFSTRLCLYHYKRYLYYIKLQSHQMFKPPCIILTDTLVIEFFDAYLSTEPTFCKKLGYK